VILFGWIAIAIAMFTLLTPRRAVLASYLIAWMFLPVAEISMPGIPDLTKSTAASLGTLLGVLIFDPGSLRYLRPHLVDLPIVVWCIMPLVSAVENGYGAYDGASGCLQEFFTWGIPYMIGRMYFTSLDALQDLAIAIIIGGLIYVPLCLFEIRFSPQLHRMVYGFHPSHFAMTIRYNSYRPMGFMRHGLMLGMWMTSASLLAIWLWRSRTIRVMYGMPMIVVAGILFCTAVLCRSTGAIALLAGGLFTLFALKYVRTSWAMVAVVMITPAYMVARTAGVWTGEDMVDAAAMLSQERARSLEGRLLNEDQLTARAMQRPLVGWGAWDRWRIFNEEGEDITVSDGMWVIAMGQTGLVGLTSLTMMLLLPVLLLIRRIGVRHWSLPASAPAAGLSMLLVLYSMDNLLNAMLNPIFVLIMGGLTGLYIRFPQERAMAMARLEATRSAKKAVRLFLQNQPEMIADDPPSASPSRRSA
ncbi:MAG: hypothetical protein AAF432_16740, partial [Planctomycetota bacterium]